MYSVHLSNRAEKSLTEMHRSNPHVGIKIVAGLQFLAKDPIGLGMALTGNLKGNYKLRIGAYRVIYRVYKNELLISVVAIGHRRDVYR